MTKRTTTQKAPKKASLAARLAAMARGTDRSHLKRQFDEAEVSAVCALMRGGLTTQKIGSREVEMPGMALTTACRTLGLCWDTFTARMREDKVLNDRIQAAKDQMLDGLMDPGNVVAIADTATKDTAAAVKTKLWARFELAGRIDARYAPKSQVKTDNTHRIEGLGGLLAEIRNAGGDVGPGPSKPV